MSEIHVLHVDDESGFADMAAAALERQDDRFVIETATGTSESLDYLDENDVDCVVSDYDMPGQNGIEFLEAVREDSPALPFILFTGKGSEKIASEAISAGVTDYLQKGSGTEQYELLANRITNAVAQFRAEQRARENTQRYEALFEHTNDAIVAVEYEGEAGIIQDVNPVFEELFVRQGEDVCGRDVNEVVTGEKQHAEAERITRQTRRGELANVEVTRQTVDGLREFRLQTVPMNTPDETGIRSAFAVYTDITERKERERELERYETIIEALADPVYAMDADGHYTFVNDAFVEQTGYSREEILGEHVSKVLSEADIKRGQEIIRFLLTDDDRRAVTWEMTRTTADGDRVPNENHLALLPPDEDGEFRGTAGVVRDITERKEREQKLERQNERLDEFASVVSHDLRNPLNVADGRLELAREDCDSEHLDAAGGALDRMNILIDNLLRLAREGKIVTDTEPIDLETIATGCWRNVETATASLVTNLDRTIHADESRLKQLFENLVRNAIEHGGESVTVTVGELDDGFYVEDDGPGIPEGDRDNVFGAGYSTGEEGIGFGLSIVKQVVEAHDWEISVTEGSEGGARFEVTGVRVVDESEGH